MKVISKSRFISGVQCAKKLYFDLYRQDLKIPVSEQQQQLFTTGHKIGELAQMVFPHGNDATPDSYYDFTNSINQTVTWIKAYKTVYEASFSTEGVLAALDILHRKNNEWWAIEVKSSSDIKEYHLNDAALQFWVMSKSGFTPDKFFLMHINTSYVKQNEVNPNELFKLVDITDQILQKQEWVTENLAYLKTVISQKNIPEISIGKQCNEPFNCEYKHHCWAHIPDQSVFDLYSPKGIDWELYNKGIVELASIPDYITLNHRQALQVNGQKYGDIYIDNINIEAFLNTWKFPLYFFDFETIFPAIPILNGTSPFQQIPFQYSLHKLDSPDAKLSHSAFLAQPIDFSAVNSIDPRKKLINQLKLDFGTEGSIVTYNAAFELTRLKELAIDFPEDSEFLLQLCDRIVDLLIPFRKGWYYKPEMGKSASIKYVLPAIDPEFSYQDLEIANGGDASSTFVKMIFNEFEGDIIKAYENLLKYCERDTLGMVVIWRELYYLKKGELK